MPLCLSLYAGILLISLLMLSVQCFDIHRTSFPKKFLVFYRIPINTRMLLILRLAVESVYMRVIWKHQVHLPHHWHLSYSFSAFAIPPLTLIFCCLYCYKISCNHALLHTFLFVDIIYLFYCNYYIDFCISLY